MTALRLLLDEHYSDEIGRRLRERGRDVVAVVADAELRAHPDGDVFDAGARTRRRIVTENVKDFRPLLQRAYEQNLPFAQLLLVPPGRFPRRTGSQTMAIVNALDAWLSAPDAVDRPDEDWLV